MGSLSAVSYVVIIPPSRWLLQLNLYEVAYKSKLNHWKDTNVKEKSHKMEDDGKQICCMSSEKNFAV